MIKHLYDHKSKDLINIVQIILRSVQGIELYERRGGVGVCVGGGEGGWEPKV